MPVLQKFAAIMASALLIASAVRGDDSQARVLAHSAYRMLLEKPYDAASLNAAVRDIRKAHDLDANEPYVWVASAALVQNLAYISGDRTEARSFQSGALDEAAGLLRKALAIDPNLGDAHADLGWILIAQKQFQQADHEFFVGHQVDPENFDVWIGQAVCWWKQGNVAKSEAALAGAERRVRSNADHLKLNGHKERMARSRHDAVALEGILREDMSLDPQSPWVHGNYALFLMDQRRYDEAIVEYKKALAIAPYPLAEHQLAEAERLRNESRKNSLR
jgi:Tfp pilus assembly protein PilF